MTPAGVFAVAGPERSGARREIQDPLGAAAVVELADLGTVDSPGEGEAVEETVVDRRGVDIPPT